MGDLHVLAKFADECFERRLSSLTPLLPFFDNTLAEQITSEHSSRVRKGKQLDGMLGERIDRCAQAKQSDILAVEMRRLRILHFLHTSRGLLRLASRRLDTQARMDGINAEITVLGIDLDRSKIEDGYAASNELPGRASKEIPWAEECRFVIPLLVGFLLVYVK
jgi:hypothetical protein